MLQDDRFVNAVHSIGFGAVRHRDVLQPSTPDDDVLEFAATKRWAVLSQDTGILTNRLALAAIFRHKGRYVFLSSAGGCGIDDLVGRLTSVGCKLRNILDTHRAPFVVLVKAGKKVEILRQSDFVERGRL